MSGVLHLAVLFAGLLGAVGLRWVGPGTPRWRGLLIALAYVAAGAALFLALRALRDPVGAYLPAAVYALSAVCAVLAPFIYRPGNGSASGGPPPSPPASGLPPLVNRGHKAPRRPSDRTDGRRLPCGFAPVWAPEFAPCGGLSASPGRCTVWPQGAAVANRRPPSSRAPETGSPVRRGR